MLDLFRKRGLSSFVYGAVIIATVLVFVIQFRPNAGQKQASLKEACVAKVKGWCVDPKDHKAAYRILIPRDQQGQLLTARAKQMGLSKIALDGLIERELLVDEADRLGLKVTDDETTDDIYNGFIRVSVPSDNPQLAYSLRVADGRIYVGFRDQKTKQFDMKVYERSIRMLVGRSPTEFREEQGRELLAAKVRDLVRAPVRVSEPEALDTYVAEKSSATVKYVPVRQSYVARYAVRPTAADVDAWAKDKANEGLVDAAMKSRKDDDAPKANHIRHILIKTPPDATDEQRAEALTKLAQAKARVDAGEAFADVARDVSDDKGSAMRGGDVGDKTDGFVAPFKNAADALKPGETTRAAIPTQFGFHLIMKDDPARAAEVEAAMKRGAARELYVKAKALGATKDLAAKIAADVAAGKTPEEAAAGAVASLPQKPAVLPAALAVEAEKTDKKPGADAGATAADAGAAAKKALVMKAVTADTDPDRPQALTSSAFNKGGDAIPGLASGATTEVMTFAFGAKDGETMKEPVRTEDGFMVVQLKEHKSANKEEFEKDKDVYLQTLLAVKQAEALAIYVKRLKETAKSEIKVDETYLLDAKPAATDGGAPATPFDEGEEEP